MREVYKPEEDDSAEAEKIEKKEVEIIDPWDQFKTYYLKPSLIALAALICVGWMIYDMFIARPDVEYSGASIGCVVTDAGKIALSDGFKSNQGMKKRRVVLFTDDIYMSFTDEDAYNNQSVDAAMFTFLATGEFNYLILDESMLKQYYSMSAFYDLTELAAAAGIDPSLIKKNEDGEALGIELPDRVCQKFGISPYNKKAYISFVPVRKTGENDLAFLKYLFAE